MLKLHRLKYCISHVLQKTKGALHRLGSSCCCPGRCPGRCPSSCPHSCPSHHPSAIMNTMSVNLSLRYVGYLSNVILMVALCVGLYTRWMISQDLIILLMALLGLFVFSISCALAYYFSLEVIGFSLSRLWIGCLLGLVAFTQDVNLEDTTPEQIMNILLLLSLLFRALWHVLERVLHFSDKSFMIVNYYECLEMGGMCIATIVTGNDVFCLSILIISLSLIVITIRLKSLLGVLELLLFIILTSTLYFPHLLQVAVNPYAMCCFLIRMSFESILDIYYCPLTTLERWQFIFNKAAFIQRLLILLVFGVEIAFMVINGLQIPDHKEWYIVVPIFVVFGLGWLCYHLVFLVTCWQLSNKISDCNSTYRSMSEDSRNMHRIMAAKGVRHFSLISQRLVCVTLATTLIMGAIGWRTKKALSMSLIFAIVPMETAVLSLLWQLGSSLGGTIIGYALVAPAFTVKLGQTTTVLPTNAMQEMSARATQVLNTVQRFLAFHLVENYGCDYSSSGLTAESVETKLKAFFQRQTADGPKYDTYLVYYSGHVHDNGDWALAGSGRLKLESLLEWWAELSGGSRLILLLDSDHSHQWLRSVRKLRGGHHVALQTCRITRRDEDPEEADRVRIGDFTAEWMDYNSANLSQVDWKDKKRLLKAEYAVSRAWADFQFHLPTEEDISQHWDANFPKVTKPLITVTNFPQLGRVCCCCECVVRCLQRKRMAWFPPTECDTGHGFKLLRS